MHQPIQWRKIGEQAWMRGVLVDGLDGLLAVELTEAPKTYLTTDRNGTTRASQTIGPWEGRYEVSTSTPTMRIKPNLVAYVYEIKEV